MPACWPVSSRNTGRADVEIEGRREGFSEPRSPRQHLHCSRSRFWGSKRGFLKRCVPTRGNTRLIHLTSHPGVKKKRPFLLCHESGGKYPPKKTKNTKKGRVKSLPKKSPKTLSFKAEGRFPRASGVLLSSQSTKLFSESPGGSYLWPRCTRCTSR